MDLGSGAVRAAVARLQCGFGYVALLGEGSTDFDESEASSAGSVGPDAGVSEKQHLAVWPGGGADLRGSQRFAELLGTS